MSLLLLLNNAAPKQFAQPDEDGTVSGVWTITGAATGWQALAGTSPDLSTFVTSSNNPSATEFYGVRFAPLNPPTDPGDLIVRVTADKDAGNRTIEMNAELRQGDGTVIGTLFMGPLNSNSPTTYEVALTPAQFAAVTDWSDLRIRLNPTTAGGGSGSTARLYWVSLEAPFGAASTTATGSGVGATDAATGSGAASSSATGAGAGTTGGSGTPVTQIALSDNFDRADAASIATNAPISWVLANGLALPNIAGNRASQTSGSTTTRTMRADAGVGGTTAYARTTVTSMGATAFTQHGPMVHMDATAATGYMFMLDRPTSTTFAVRLRKQVANTRTDLTTNVTVTSLPVTLEVRAEPGGIVTGWADGVQVASATDASPLTATAFTGIYYTRDQTFDDFEAGVVVANTGPATGSGTGTTSEPPAGTTGTGAGTAGPATGSGTGAASTPGFGVGVTTPVTGSGATTAAETATGTGAGVTVAAVGATAGGGLGSGPLGTMPLGGGAGGAVSTATGAGAGATGQATGSGTGATTEGTTGGGTGVTAGATGSGAATSSSTGSGAGVAPVGGGLSFLVAQPFTALGDSWSAQDLENTPGQRAIVQLQNRLNLGTLALRAVSSQRLGDQVAQVIGTASPYVAGTAALAVVAAGFNDLLSADTPQKRVAFAEHLRAGVATLSVAQRFEQSLFTLQGTWTANNTVAACSGGTNRAASTDGSTATITIDTPGTYYLMTLGTDGSTIVGGSFTVSQGGVTLAAVDTNQKHVNSATTLNSGFGPLALRLPNMVAGELTITFSTEGRAGAFGYLDALFRMSDAPPVVLVSKIVQAREATRQKPDLLASFNASIDTIAGEFDHVVVCDPTPGWDPLTMIGGDAVHPNDLGMDHLADAYVATLEAAFPGGVAASGAGSVGTTGTGAGAAGQAAGSGVASTGAAGTGAGAVAPATGSGSFSSRSTGTGAGTTGAATGAGAAVARGTGAGAGVTGPATGSGAATTGAVGSGAGSTGAATSSGAGAASTSGTGAGAAGAATGSGAGATEGTSIGTGAGTTSSATGSGAGAARATGSGAGATGASTGSGAAAARATGTGTAATAPATGTGAAAVAGASGGAGSTSPAVGSGAGQTTSGGTGSGVVGRASGSGAGSVGVAGSGVGQAGGATGAGSGASVATGGGAGQAGAAAGAGTGGTDAIELDLPVEFDLQVVTAINFGAVPVTALSIGETLIWQVSA